MSTWQQLLTDLVRYSVEHKLDISSLLLVLAWFAQETEIDLSYDEEEPPPPTHYYPH